MSTSSFSLLRLSHTELKRLLHKKDELRTALRVAGGRPWKDFWAELDANKVGCIPVALVSSLHPVVLIP